MGKGALCAVSLRRAKRQQTAKWELNRNRVVQKVEKAQQALCFVTFVSAASFERT